MGRRYGNGVILGRFQPFHRGHAAVVSNALEKADKVLVLVGSSQESRTERNPYSFEERAEFIKKVFPERVIIAPLPDLGIGDVNGWGEYVIANAEKALGEEIECFFLGSEGKNAKWFSPERRARIDVAELDRAIIRISATEVRGYLLADEEEKYRESMCEPLHEDYQRLRDILLSIK